MAGIADYLPTLFNAPGNPTADQHARDAMIAALARGGGTGAGDYSPIQSKWQGAARLAEGLKTGLANYAQGAAAKQGATDLANVLAPALQQPPAQQQITPLPPPPQQAAPAASGAGGGGIGGLISALGGTSPIGPSTSVPLQALSPRESAGVPPALSVGPTPMQPALPVAPVPAPAPVSQVTPQEIQGNQALQDALAAGNRAPAPMVAPQASVPLPPVRVADAGQVPVPLPRPENQVPLPISRPLLTTNGPTEAPVPPMRPLQVATPLSQPASSGGFFGPGGGFDQYRNITAQIESGGGTVPDRPGSQYHGTYQLGPGWGGTGTEEERFARGTQDNFNTLRNNLGRDPTQGELYLAHQQGAGGALSLINNPDTPAGQLVPARHISANGGDPNAPASDFINKWASRYGAPTEQLAGGSPGLITPGQRQIAQTVNGPGIYPQTATQGNPAIGAMPLPARQGLSNAPFMQPQQPPAGQQQNLEPRPPSPPIPPPPPDTGPRSGLAPLNQLAQNIYGQSYSDLPLFTGKEQQPASPVPAPKGTAEEATQGAELPPLPPRPRINTQAALAYLSNPLYAGQQYAAQRQLVLQMLQHQMTQDAAGQFQQLNVNGTPVQRNTATNQLSAFPSNPNKETDTTEIKNYNFYKNNFAPTQNQPNPMTFEQWNIAKQNAGKAPADQPVMGRDGQPLAEDLKGQDVLAAVPQPVGIMAQRYIDGREVLPNITSRTPPMVVQARLAAQQADPMLDQTESKTRAGTRKDFTSGPTSKVITAGNTALGHLTELSELVPQLGNVDWAVGGTPANAVVNAIKGTGASGQTLAKFNELNQLYSAEMEKFYAGSSGGTAGERKQLELNISPNMTPTQQNAAIQQAALALASKVEALQGQWHAGMGPLSGDFDVIHAENKPFVESVRAGVLGRLGQPGGAPAAPAVPAQTAPTAQPKRFKYDANGNLTPE
jgi:hypothetical protein